MKYKLKGKKFALDMDGVVRNFTQGIIDYFNKTRPGQSGFPNHWSQVTTWGMGERFDELFKEVAHDTDFWRWLPPMPCSLPIPFKVHCYITHSPISEGLNAWWLSYNGFPSAPVHTVALIEQKIVVAQQEGIDVFVDDKPETVRAMIHSGITAFLFDATYNQEATDLPRIKTLAELRQ